MRSSRQARKIQKLPRVPVRKTKRNIRNATGGAFIFLCLSVLGVCIGFSISGRVLDPQGNPIPGAAIQLVQKHSGISQQSKTDEKGKFEFTVESAGEYLLKADVPGFQPIEKTLDVSSGSKSIDIQLQKLATRNESASVTASLDTISITSPDPGERVLVRQEMLDANPGRPGAPVSIPGLPIETASGGIKAPQYFVPGVAGDHGEPLAQYVAVGGYLLTNNLSANAHGNGYADPNIFVSGALGSVTTDGRSEERRVGKEGRC